MNFLPRETLIVVCTAGAIATTVAPMTTPTPPELSKPLEQATVVLAIAGMATILAEKNDIRSFCLASLATYYRASADPKMCHTEKNAIFCLGNPPCLAKYKSVEQRQI
ncbi:MAG: hypothetical protein HC786_20390 [Richelia sp. CSU_2_1]|nr:hypothetical protein [Richelia sp. CSU_2_1]